ncbi:MAG: zinc ribbon domain-containing protein [Chloroflexota bacterium]|nr:zinc ribbon domain-containing protein [Chloroflexota bacterium]
MPTYGYRCADCGNAFEQVQRMSDPSLTSCPTCFGRITRVIHPIGVVFKGSGWYINDSRSAKSKSASNGKDSSDEPKSRDDDSAKPSDTAKEAKTEPAAANNSPAKSKVPAT